jgi:tripartite-type tricarboxylate transporter receptor subunit TctC
VPTFAELGLAGFEDVPYYGVFAPTGTPKAVVDRFSDALAKAVAMPDVKEKLTALGLTVAYSPSQQIDKNIQAYTQVWSRIIKASGFQAQ